MILQNIHNGQELISCFKKENNSYSEFILSRLLRKSTDLGQQKTQFHHIIPKHESGPDLQWNLIRLTIEEHAQAHELLFENYHHVYDLGASQMIRGQFKEGWDIIQRKTLETRRENKSDRFNSDIQRELGRRPKKQRQRYARNLYVKAALTQGFDLYNKKSESIVKIGPCECNHMVDVINKLMSYPDMANERDIWLGYKKKEKYPVLTGLTRLLTGHVDKRTRKALFSYKNWRILGINIIIE